MREAAQAAAREAECDAALQHATAPPPPAACSEGRVEGWLFVQPPRRSKHPHAWTRCYCSFDRADGRFFASGAPIDVVVRARAWWWFFWQGLFYILFTLQ